MALLGHRSVCHVIRFLIREGEAKLLLKVRPLNMVDRCTIYDPINGATRNAICLASECCIRINWDQYIVTWDSLLSLEVSLKSNGTRRFLTHYKINNAHDHYVTLTCIL